MIDLICIISIIVNHYTVYRRINSNKLEISFNVKINNLLILHNFGSFNKSFLNNKKFKLISLNNVLN